jgi:serine/threonine protein kinase
MTTYEPGSVIAGYRIDSLLGRGGMAVVYRAEDVRLGRKVALKLLTPERADDEQFRQRFIQESRLAASLDHPNIVPIYGAGENDGQLYIAMRYVVGPDLKDLLADQGGRLPLDVTLGLFRQIGEALDAAHRAGLVHRDVKPANILIAESQQYPGDAGAHHAYLTDFGLTKRTTEPSPGLTSTGHFLGTVDYVSPEQIQGKPVGPGADIYALGCVLYQCLTGLPPYRRDDDAALLFAHLIETPAPVSSIRPEVPDAVDAVVARAMAKDPADRYGSCEELVDDLESAFAVAEDEVRQPSGPIVAFPAPADDPDEAAPSEDWLLFEESAQPAGPAVDERDAATVPAPFPVADSGWPVVTAQVSSVPADDPRPSGSRRRRSLVRLVVVGLLALALGADAAGAEPIDPVEAMAVQAEPADSVGDDPFTPTTTPTDPGQPADGGPAPDAEGGAPKDDAPVTGDTPGLYGGTGTEICDPAAMVAFFDTHPDRAQAWADALGIPVGEIEAFLGTLTPVVLLTDTAVTNHGFRDGEANAYQAVLEAGTAVLVDEYGVPRVRCACGNPLDAPTEVDQVEYTGETWSGLGDQPVTVIEPAPESVESFVVVVAEDDTTALVDRPRGTDGDQDEPAATEDEAAGELPEDPTTAEPGADGDGSTGTGEEPTTGGTTGEDPAPEGSTGGESTTDGSTGSGEEPTTEGSTGEEPTTEGSTGEEPTTEGTTTEGTTGTGEEPTTEESTGENPAPDGSTGEEPATDGSTGTGEEPTTDGSTGENPATDGSTGTDESPVPDETAGTENA